MKNDYYQDDTITLNANTPFTAYETSTQQIITGLDPDINVLNTIHPPITGTRSDTVLLQGIGLGIGLDVDATLVQRGSRYGEFKTHAQITQDLKETMRLTDNWELLQPFQVEALEMIAHKIGRILNGDPNYDDSWVDIAGYAKLVADRL